MAEMIKTIEHLATEIGPRPVATEEEQQAALYIAQEFKNLNLSVEVEEFQGSVSHKKTRLVCSSLAVVFALLSVFLPVIALPAVIVTFICAVLFMSEELGKPILSKFLDKGISQNVIARYVPESEQEGKGRRRKVLLVARTDSGAIRPELNASLLTTMPILARAARIAMIVLPVFLLIRSVFFLHATGAVFVITTILLVLVCLCAALTTISFIVEKTSGLNDGANSSASGLAVMLEVARRITQENADEQPIIHGEQAAYEAGLVPEGTQLTYESLNQRDEGENESNQYESNQHESNCEDEFVSHVAAGYAANDYGDTQSSGATRSASAVSVMTVPAAVVAGAAAGFAVDTAKGEIVDAATIDSNALSEAFDQQVVPAVNPSSAREVPSWFSAGRAAAKRKEPSNKKEEAVKRSTFATALEAAEQRLNEAAQELSFEENTGVDKTIGVEETATEKEPTAQESFIISAAEKKLTEQAMPAPAASQVTPAVSIEPETTGVPVSSEAIETIAAIETPTEPAMSATPVESTTSPAEPTSVPMDYFIAAAVGAQAGDTVVAKPVEAQQARPVLTLPDLSVTGTLPVIDVQKQRAPLAEAEEESEVAAKGLLTMLPSIDDEPSSSAEAKISLPSLSGVIETVPDLRTQAFEPVAGATGSFAPVTEALALQATSEEDLFVEDADDSVFEENYTETGAYAGPEYVDMPKKRGLGVFGKLFGGKKHKEDLSNGDWNSEDDDYLEDDPEYENGAWKGGAFSGKLSELANGAAGVASRVRGALPSNKENQGEEKRSGRVVEDTSFPESVSYRTRNAGAPRDRFNRAHQHDAESEFDIQYNQEELDDFDNDDFAYADDNQEWQHESGNIKKAANAENEAYAQVCQILADRYGNAENNPFAANTVNDDERDAVQQSIEDFRAGGIDIETWFVALGAETDCHVGMEEFIASHHSELRGAIVIELDSLGAGTLCTVEKEGVLKTTTMSSRMKRYAKKAARLSGVEADTTAILWQESAASTAIKNGIQAMHLVGMDGAKPAFYAQADDVLENIDSEILEQNAQFVVEVMRSI